MTLPRTLLIILATAFVVVLVIGRLPYRPGEPEISHGFLTSSYPSFQPTMADALAERFALCDETSRVDCVVDGDTIWFRSEKIRIADIDAPEIFSPHCRDERSIGEASRDRLLELLNGGSFTLVAGWRDTDRFGRKLRTVTRHGRSLGEMLVEEGLARRWNAPRRNWCAPY
ncbi:thermonuclease family protein (plasmid) [Agrobacterium sp. rho-13.3]|uniref:thermonuclease family protein n=1 Tax=Agrobacterium sp. rho-13.3 TaxID=3072980 RepID=UPI002A0CFBE1|nr:thermonuclease family protein [Agrobacterium sp. rho-13.3]MDX8311979.1 thermonuclease family protein [Agrobacterium sp. rho-13.3]